MSPKSSRDDSFHFFTWFSFIQHNDKALSSSPRRLRWFNYLVQDYIQCVHRRHGPTRTTKNRFDWYSSYYIIVVIVRADKRETLAWKAMDGSKTNDVEQSIPGIYCQTQATFRRRWTAQTVSCYCCCDRENGLLKIVMYIYVYLL